MRLVLPLFAVLATATVSAFAMEIDQSAYLPLTAGNDWTMDVVFTSPSGEVSKATGRRRLEDTVEMDGKSYVRSRTWTEDGPTPMEYTKLVRKDGDGMYSLLEGGKNEKEQLEIPLPLRTSMAWTHETQGMKFFDRALGVESVTIGDKTYAKCFHFRVESADGKYREDYWEAPKLGNVKSEIVYSSGAKITLTLREFKAGK